LNSSYSEDDVLFFFAQYPLGGVSIPNTSHRFLMAVDVTPMSRATCVAGFDQIRTLSSSSPGHSILVRRLRRTYRLLLAVFHLTGQTMSR
jgi:hypothetical protein